MTGLSARAGTSRLPPLPGISLRRYDRGGGFRNAATLDPVTLLQNADHLLLYVHGYNNSRFQAVAAYDGFRVGITGLDTIGQAGVYWPGESMPRQLVESTAPGGFAVLKSLPSYTAQVPNAKTSADMIADRIMAEVRHRQAVFVRHPIRLRTLSISIVAHSLGCRVALELLDRFTGTMKTNLEFPLVALMAPAVPNGLVTRKGDLRKALEHPTNVIVYSSPNDEALGIAFRLFELPHLSLWQMFRGGNQAALGLTGAERTRNIHRRHGTGLHGDYWTSATIAGEVRSVLETGKVKSDAGRTLSIPERYVRLTR